MFMPFHLSSSCCRAIAHDPKRYPESDEFKPDRFFDSDGQLNDDDVGYVFGFGRRYVCFSYSFGLPITGFDLNAG